MNRARFARYGPVSLLLLAILGGFIYMDRRVKYRIEDRVKREVARGVQDAITKQILPAIQTSIQEALGSGRPAYDLDRTWGSYGTGEAQFRSAYGTAINEEKGWYYITDCYNQNVQTFDREGKFLFSWGKPGKGRSEFDYPGGIAVNRNGIVFVSEEHNQRVQYFTPEGGYLGEFGTKGKGPGQFEQPLGVAVDSKDNVYVTDLDGHRVQKFTPEGKFLLEWGGEGREAGKFHGPYNLASDSEDNLYVVDRGNNRIQKFTAEGRFLAMWGRNGGDGSAGLLPGELNWPHELAVDAKDRIYVSDTYNYRIQVFSKDGELLFKWGSVREWGVPKTVEVDRDFNLYVCDMVGTLGYVTKWKPGAPGSPGRTGSQGAAADPLPDFPKRLSGFGVYASLPALETDPSRAAFYRPHYELWTNGAAKTRHVALPAGKKIDNRDRRSWTFPDGTLFFKTFSYPGPDPRTARPVETRVIRFQGGRWEYAAYRWADDLSDAGILDGNGPVEVEVSDARGGRFRHVIPSRNNCLACHARNRTFIIGFNEMQLNSNLPGRDRTQLAELVDRDLFVAPLPADPARVEGRTDLEREVKGYIHANCATCHNNDLTWDFSHERLLATASGVPPRRNAGLLLAPGKPEESAMYQLFIHSMMPPVGVQVHDREAAEKFRSWIESLPP